MVLLAYFVYARVWRPRAARALAAGQVDVATARNIDAHTFLELMTNLQSCAGKLAEMQGEIAQLRAANTELAGKVDTLLAKNAAMKAELDELLSRSEPR